MNISKELEKIGITPLEKIKLEEKDYIAKTIADKLTKNIKELSNSYNELYMRIFNSNMCYANIDQKFRGVFYYYKNNTIYIDDKKDLSNIDDYLIHESIHYLQNFGKINKKTDRAGICQFREFKIFGLGINEAIVQYITARALESPKHRINNDKITIYTNSENYYKYMTSLICQILFLIGDKEAIQSCINSTDTFENELYNTFEENTEKIVKNFDIILEENNKTGRNENKIIDIYMQTQDLIYTTYFTKMYKRLNTLQEVDEQIRKIEEYEKMTGKLLGTQDEENKFTNFKTEMSEKYFKKIIEVNRKQSKDTLVVVYKNKLYSIWSQLVKFIQRKTSRNKIN